jgi:hypothetical protein
MKRENFIKSFHTALLLLFSFYSYGQNNDVDREINDGIKAFRRATVSFGIDTSIYLRDVNGTIIIKRVYLAVGTGITFYLKSKLAPSIPCLITAKHVIKNLSKIRIRFNECDSLPINKYFGIEYRLDFPDGTRNWVAHPDSTVDLVCILLDSTINNSNLSSLSVLPYRYFPDVNDYFEGKEIFTLGYPTAIGYELLNRAVLRRGIISWLPMEMKKENKFFLVDCSIFPGNSGGPIFSLPKNFGYVLSDTILQKPKFLGIVTQRRFSNQPLISDNGQNVYDGQGNLIYSQESVGIGVVEPAFKVQELLATVQAYVDKLENEYLKETEKKVNKR